MNWRLVSFSMIAGQKCTIKVVRIKVEEKGQLMGGGLRVEMRATSDDALLTGQRRKERWILASWWVS